MSTIGNNSGEVMDIDADTGGYKFAGDIFDGVCGG
jgi:predicted flavoprotein YhiN